jgi:hypothetical protein
MQDNVCMKTGKRILKLNVLMSVALGASFLQVGHAQDNSNKSWSSSNQQEDPSGAANPFRTTTTHREVNGRTIDRTVVETRGPDGRYVPYSDTEKESVRVNDTTVRSIERNYANNADGQRTMTQERQEEQRTLPGGESKTVQTVSNPDANGALQVVQRTQIDAKHVGPGVRDTNTTVFSADGNGGLSATVRIQEHERQVDAKTVESSKSTSLSDGVGHWNVSEIREGTTRQDQGGSNKEERVLRPDGEGKMALVERTVTRQAAGAGEKRDTTETYSTNVPGQAGSEGLQLVRRETTVQRTGASGAQSTTRQVEGLNAGDPNGGLSLTQEAIDIVRPGADGAAKQTSTVMATDSNGNLNAVWVDMGSNNKPAAVKVDTVPAPKKK